MTERHSTPSGGRSPLSRRDFVRRSAAGAARIASVGPPMADVASAGALSLGPGTKVALRVDPAGIRLLPRG